MCDGDRLDTIAVCVFFQYICMNELANEKKTNKRGKKIIVKDINEMNARKKERK